MSFKLVLLLLILKLTQSRELCHNAPRHKLTQVVCSNFHSEVTIPNERDVEKLTLKNISGTANLSNFTLNNLRQLHIVHSDLENINLGTLPKLVFLTFLKNPKLPQLVLNNSNLQWLLLISNNHTIHSQFFHFLPNLTWLHLQNENLHALSGDYFATNHNLQELTVRNCKLATLSNDTFIQTRNLEILSLNFNKLTSFQTGTFQHLHKLKILELHHNLFVDYDLNQFRGLTGVEILGLPSSLMRNCDFNKLREVMPNLKQMEIKKKDRQIGTKVRKAGFSIIGTPYDCHSNCQIAKYGPASLLPTGN